MSKRESFLSRGEDDDDYWLASSQLQKLKSSNVFDDLDDDTIEDDQWAPTTDWERLPRVPAGGSFSAGAVSDRLAGSARYRADTGQSASSILDDDQSDVDAAVRGVEFLGIQEPSYKDLADDIEPVQLRKSVVTRRKSSSAVTPEATVKDILLGQPYSLEQFKSKEEKLALLDAAIETKDGNAITAITLFLKNTLKKSIFNKALQTRPEAVNHYTHFLKAHYDFTDLEDTLCMFQRTEDAAILKYNLAVSKQKSVDRVRALQTCHRTHFEYEPSLANDGHLVKQHISLLERQLPIEDNDKKAIVEDTSYGLRDRPRLVNSIINLPLLSTVHYCCLYHYADPPVKRGSRPILGSNYLTSPHGIRDEFKLDEREFLYWAVKARAAFHDYGAIETLLTSKSWYGGKKMKSVIPWEKVVEIVSTSSAPAEVLMKYLKLVEDESSRFALAHKYKCHKVAVDTLISMKDRRQLEGYVPKVLTPSSPEYRFAQDALNGSTVKWKN